MQNLEDILNQALAEIGRGSSVEEALSKRPQQAAELEPLLQTALLLSGLPRARVPQPAMRRKYVLEPVRTAWYASARILRWSSVSMAAMLLIAAVSSTAYAAWHSLPGERLFTLKKGAEQLQLKLTTDPVTRANLQVLFAQKRLDEAQQIFNSPQKNPSQEIAALTELSQQTQETVSTVQDVASSKSIGQNNQPIVKSLTDLTQKQTALLNQIKPDSGVQDAASGALAANTEAKKFIAVVAAAGDTTTLANLPAGSTTVTASGNVSAVGKNSLTVDATTFAVDSTTEIKDPDQQPLDFNIVTSTSTVSVIGVKTNKTLVAKEIVVVVDESAATPPAGVAASSTASSTLPSQTDPSSTPASLKKSTPAKQTEDDSSTSTAPADSQAPLGTFIYENPAPQYAP